MAAALLLLSIHALTWDASERAEWYTVYFSHSPCGEWLKVASVPLPQPVYLPQNDPLPGVVFHYIVTASNSAGESPTEHDGPCPGGSDPVASVADGEDLPPDRIVLLRDPLGQAAVGIVADPTEVSRRQHVGQ